MNLSHAHRTGFFRVAWSATLMETRMEPSQWARIVAVVDPIMDRLAALLDAFDGSGVDIPFGDTSVYLRALSGPLDLQKHPPRFHTVDSLPTARQLAARLPRLELISNDPTLGAWFEHLARGWAVAVTPWRTPTLVRTGEHLEREIPVRDYSASRGVRRGPQVGWRGTPLQTR